MITILFGIKNKQDDENQEQVDDRKTYWKDPSPSEQEEIEEVTSVSSRDSRPQRDCSVPEVYRVVDPKGSLSTTRPGSVSGSVSGLEHGPCEVSVYHYFDSTGNG